MTPNRTTLKPLSCRNCASSSSKPLSDGSYGASLYTSFTPCRITTCPSLVVSQVPLCDRGGSGPLSGPAAAVAPELPTAPWLPSQPAVPPAPPSAWCPVARPPTPLLPASPP